MKRYILAIGKFGVYFYDTLKKEDLTLERVLYKLNLLDILEKEKEEE